MSNKGSIASLDDLDKKAGQAATLLTKASSENAVWDKAVKTLGPVLAGLASVQEDAQKEVDQTVAPTDGFIQKCKGNYSSDLIQSITTASTKFQNDTITPLEATMTGAEGELTKAKKAVDGVDGARAALRVSTAKFDAAQKDLLELPQKIEAGKKRLVALRAEIEDAGKKQQQVEALLKIQDLEKMLADFREDISKDHEASLWNALDAAAQEVVQKTQELQVAQDKVPKAEKACYDAKSAYEEAQRNRLDSIKAEVEKEKAG
jgi:hypothetical protein